MIKKNFSLDLRSLALFRVCASVILMVDFFCTRFPYFDLFYTNKGVLPLKQLFAGESFWANTSSLNFVSSSPFYQSTLFILAILFFFMLLVGYKTRLAVLGAWVLLVSFQSRNFLILNSGDTLFCVMLFWALRLPLGEYFSIDSALKEKRQKTVFSVNSLAFIFQILFVYYFTYLLKTDPIWKSGQGVYYALQLDNFRTVWGDMLLPYPHLMKTLSIITYYIIEALVPFAFIFLGFWWRFKTLLILMMCGFHLSLGLFLHLGCFSWICMAGWLAFLPSEFWEMGRAYLPGQKGFTRLHRWFSKGQLNQPAKKRPLYVYYDGACVFCKKMVCLMREFLILPHLVFKPSQSDKKASLEMEKRNSWLVFTPTSDTDNGEKGGIWQDRWPAFIKLVSYSPLFFWIAPLLKWKFLSQLGDRFYKMVAKNRQKLGSYLKFLKSPPTTGQRKSYLSVIMAGFFSLCFLYVFMWNIRTLDFNYYSKFMPRSWNGVGAFLHLHQYWNMFAPKPLDTTGWIILFADTGREGEPIDLWRKGAPLSYEKPVRYDMTFPVFRIRKLMENLTLEHKRYSKNYLHYLCRKWNKGTKSIKSIKFIFMKQKVVPYGEPLPPPEKVVIRRLTCPQSG